MTKIGLVNLGAVKEALIPYSKEWVKKEYPQYVSEEPIFRNQLIYPPIVDFGTIYKDQEIDRKASEIIELVAKQEKVDLIIKDDVVLHISNDLVRNM